MARRQNGTSGRMDSERKINKSFQEVILWVASWTFCNDHCQIQERDGFILTFSWVWCCIVIMLDKAFCYFCIKHKDTFKSGKIGSLSGKNL